MPNRDAFPPEIREMFDGPYWRVVVRPQKHQAELIPFSELRTDLERIQVRMRGWFFPHLTNRQSEVEQGTNYYGTWSVFGNYEYWRFYQSGQLVHYHGVREVVDSGYRARVEEITHQNLDRLKPDWSTVRGYFDIINFLYTVTEIYVFAARLAEMLALDEPLHIEVGLKNIDGFILTVGEHGRSWHNLYRWAHEDLEKSWDIEVSKLTSDPGQYALEAVGWFFQRFGWSDVNLHALRDTQSSFLRARY